MHSSYHDVSPFSSEIILEEVESLKTHINKSEKASWLKLSFAQKHFYMQSLIESIYNHIISKWDWKLKRY